MVHIVLQRQNIRTWYIEWDRCVPEDAETACIIFRHDTTQSCSACDILSGGEIQNWQIL